MRPFIPKIPISSIQPSPSATSHLPPPQLNFKFDPTMVSTRSIVYCNVRCCFNFFLFVYVDNLTAPSLSYFFFPFCFSISPLFLLLFPPLNSFPHHSLLSSSLLF